MDLWYMRENAHTKTDVCMSTCHCLFASGLLPLTQRPWKILTHSTYQRIFWEVCSNTTYNSCPYTCQTFEEYLLSTRNYHWRWFVPWSSIWCHLGNRHQFDVIYEVDTSEWFMTVQKQWNIARIARAALLSFQGWLCLPLNKSFCSREVWKATNHWKQYINRKHLFWVQKSQGITLS